MKEKFAVDGAPCMCNFGTAPARMKVTDQKFAHINGKSLAGTSMNLGNVFYPPAFAVCRASWPPKTCVPNVVMWSDTFTKAKVNRIATLLTDQSKATCVMGGMDCIRFISHGQIPMPVTMKQSPLLKQIDPTGEKLFNGQPLDCLKKVTVEET
ncbi:MAG: DUF4280 domain-containing protein [Tannerella sp.]|jgi:hypothetical protein|nr:DUF4280 domain-containing protein [Tannerella sp.]